MEEINSTDLYFKKYSMEVLEYNIENLLLYAILKTQYLTKEFVVDYILNEDYQITEEEKYIDESIVIRYQPHLKIDLFGE